MPIPLSLPTAAVCACLALGTMTAPNVAFAATHQPPAADPALHLTIAGPEADPELAGLLQGPVEAMLAERGYRPEPAAPRGIFLIVHVDETAADTHEIEVRLEHTGNTTFYPTTRCVRCGSKDLLETIERALGPAFDELDAGGPSAPSEPAEAQAAEKSGAEPETQAPTKPEPTAVQPAPTAADDNPDRLGRQGIAGVALLSAGLTATAAGAALWASKESDHPTRSDMILRLEPPGITLVAVGGAATVSGIVLLALDRRQARARATTAAPLLGNGLAGLSVAGRF